MPTEPDDRRSAAHAGKVALITGGGRGFGKAFGHALAARGAHVVQVDVDGAAVDAAAAEIRAAGGAASAQVCDVTDEDGVGAVIDAVVDAHGGLDILINNAGLHSAEFNVPMADTGVARLRDLFEVNVMGTIICTLAARPAMAGRPGACVVNLSSAAAYPCSTAYGVSKLAVKGLTVTSAREMGADGIRVNAIAPGLIFTDTIRAELPQDVIDSVKGQQIIDIDGTEDDVVEAMLYLVSDRARLVTGETIRVSGGFTLQA